MLGSFLKYLQFEKRYSVHTIDAYQHDLLQLQTYLSGTFPDSSLQIVSYQELRSWLISLLEDGISPRSVNRKLATLRTYYKFLLKREIISKDPTLKLSALRTSKPLPSFIKEGEVTDLLNQFDFDNGNFGLRDRLVLELLYGTGIRLSELINLKFTNVRMGEGVIKVLGKRNKERIIPIPMELGTLLQTYIDSERSEGYVIVTDKGKKTYPMFIYRLVKNYLTRFTTSDKKSPHVLRHTFATHLLNKGADLNAVKDLLGHSSLAATQVYTHNTIEKLKTVFKQAHPKA